MYRSDAPKETLVAPPEKSRVQEENILFLKMPGTNGSSKGNLSKWRAIAHYPSTEMIWFDEGDGQSSQ